MGRIWTDSRSARETQKKAGMRTWYTQTRSLHLSPMPWSPNPLCPFLSGQEVQASKVL